MEKRDCYEVLGLTRAASQDEIKKAYRKKALEFHPDRNQGNRDTEDKFKEATEAYQILSDPNNRQKYDQFGHAAFRQSGGSGGFDGFGEFAGFEDIFGDIFGGIFGGGSGRKARGKAGRDMLYELEIDFEQAVFGAEKEIKIARKVQCTVCSGSGAKAGTKPDRCNDCGGAGQIRMQQGFFTVSRACPRCAGAGQTFKEKCETCHGAGAKTEQAKISVKIPAGIDSNQRLKLRGEGEAGSGGGQSGDLYVDITVKDHPIFKRIESDIFCEQPISYTDAALGNEFDVPTLEGPVKLKVPAGTQSGKSFRLKNKGVQVLGTSRRGDQLVKVLVEVPHKLSAKRRELLEKLRELEKEEEPEEDRTFFDKVKDIFV